ncbi:hypothetical protein KIPB_011359, partial [Kipferlia bialata]
GSCVRYCSVPSDQVDTFLLQTATRKAIKG